MSHRVKKQHSSPATPSEVYVSELLRSQIKIMHTEEHISVKCYSCNSEFDLFLVDNGFGHTKINYNSQFQPIESYGMYFVQFSSCLNLSLISFPIKNCLTCGILRLHVYTQ